MSLLTLALLIAMPCDIGGRVEKVYPISAKVAPQVYTVKNSSIQKYTADIIVSALFDNVNFPAKIDKRSLANTVSSINNICLDIDGNKEYGILGILKAVHRLSLYTFNKKKDGYVYYSYNIRYKNLSISRSTTMSHKVINLSTSVVGFKKSIRLNYANIDICIKELNSDLIFDINAFGSIRDFKCCIINALARRAAPKQIRSGMNSAITASVSSIIKFREKNSMNDIIYKFINRIKNGIRGID